MKHNVPTLKVLRVSIISLSVLFIIALCVFFGALFDELSPYKPSTQSVLYTLQSGNYTYLRSDLGYYTAAEIAADDTLSECYAIMLYFENSVLYHAYADTDPATAALYEAARQENAAEMGDLSYYAYQIDALF